MTNLREIEENTSLKAIFVGGKGGVGKTTTSCALAVRLAATRDKVLLISTDPAHNVSDALQQELTSEPQAVEGVPNLYALELDGNLMESSSKLSKKDDSMNWLSKFPGTDELLGFTSLMQYALSDDYDVVVFDTAPTGHTLRMLGLPAVIDKIQDLLSNPMLQSATQMLGAAGSELTTQVDRLLDTNDKIKKLLADPDKVTFVGVCIPEFLAIFETERLVQSLTAMGIDISHIVVNHVLETDLNANQAEVDALCVEYAQADDKSQFFETFARKYVALNKFHEVKQLTQKKQLDNLQDLYSEDYNICHVGEQPSEIKGLEGLKSYAEHLMK